MLCLCLYFVFVLVLLLPCISVFRLCFVLRIAAGEEVDVVRSRLQATSFTGGLLLLPLGCLLSADIAFLRRQGTHCPWCRERKGGGHLMLQAHPPPIPPPHPTLTLTQPNHPTPHISQQPHPHYSSLQETRWSSSSLSWLNFTKTLLLLLLMMILWIRKLCTK